MKIKISTLLCLVVLLCGVYSEVSARELIVYSARQEFLIKPILDEFTSQTGIEVKLHSDKAGALFARLQAEGKNTRADLLITSDAGNLWNAAEFGLLKRADSNILKTNIPSKFRSPENLWFGLTIRARTIIYNPEMVLPKQLSTYQDLAQPKWERKLCLRTSKNVYNQSLVAVMIEKMGYDQAKNIVKGWTNNLATKPFASDTSLIEAIAAGQCAVGLANSYYLARILTKNPKFKANIFWANQNADGVHVNISGAGIISYTKKTDLALMLLEFLAQDTAQKMFAKLDFEYPINPAIKPAKVVENWGDFKSDFINISAAGANQKSAIILMNEVGYR